MRILAALAVIAIAILSVACGPGGIVWQPPQQGEWGNFKNTGHQVSDDARTKTSPEKPAIEK